MIERLNFKITVPNKGRGPGFKKILTLDKVIRFIQSKGYQPEVEHALIKAASGYPFNALSNFVENLDVHLFKVKKDLLK